MAQGYRPITVGTICITSGSKVPLLNDGILVVVTGIKPASQDGLRAAHLLEIQRVDGQPFGKVENRAGSHFYKHRRTWIQGWRLRPIDPDGKTEGTAQTTAAPTPVQAVA